MYAVVVTVALAANPMVGPDAGASGPDATEASRRQTGAHTMSAEVRALFGDLIVPVHGAAAHWTVPMFDRRVMSETFLVTLAREIPKSIEGVQISRLRARGAAGEKGFVVVGSGGVHLILVPSPHDHLGVFGEGYCRPGVGGLALGNDGSIEWGACWKEALGRFEMRSVKLPQPN